MGRLLVGGRQPPGLPHRAGPPMTEARPRGTDGVAPRLALAVLALLLLAAPAAAHSDLDESQPADGSRLDEAPTWVLLRFSGAIEPSASSVKVMDAAGARIDLGDLRTEGSGDRPVLNLSLHPDVGAGSYRIQWRILSDDGHPNSGQVGFAVGNTTPPAEAAAMPRVDGEAVAGRALAYAGLALAFGAAAWRWLVRPASNGMAGPAAKALTLGALLNALGALLLLDATARSAGVGLGVLVSSPVGGRLFLRLLAATAALAVAGLALVPNNRSRLGGPVATALLAVSAVATASVGHAAGEGLSGLLVDAMHLIASATWVGGLVLFVVALRRARRERRTAEEVRTMGLRFGTVALACVILLVLAGLATTFVILGRAALLDPLHLAGSLYGRLLLAKVGLAALMVALAAANRFLFLDPAGRSGLSGRLAGLGPDGTSAGLRRTLFAEATLGLAVLVVAGFLTAVSPSGHDADVVHDHGAAAADAAGFAPVASASLISPAGHGKPMMVPPSLAPLHDGHDGGSVFDAYNITIGLIVVALLVAVGFLLYKVAKRRRGD